MDFTLKDEQLMIQKTARDFAKKELEPVAQKLDKTAGTSTMHKNTAARKKSQLAKRLNAVMAKKI